MNRFTLFLWALATSQIVLMASIQGQELRLEVEQLTRGSQHHFFGYIGQSLTCPWNKSERFILALRTTFHDRMPQPSDAADIVLIDCKTGHTVRKIDQTRAWNFQQGTMFYWNPKQPETQFFFNDRDPATQHVFTVLYDIQQQRRVREYRFDDVPVANGGVSPNGEFFLAINYARMARLRPVTGYPGLDDPTADVLAPADDGIFRVDIESGQRKLLVSFLQLRELLRNQYDKIDEAAFYINHSLCSRTGKDVYFFARANVAGEWKYVNSPCSVNTAGGDLKAQQFIGGHPEWDEGTVVIGAKAKQQVRYDILRQEIIGQIGNEGDFPNPEGDVSLAPDGNWFANGYALPGGKFNQYALMRRSDRLILRSKSFSRGMFTGGDLRIDQAPSWNRSSNAILVSGMTDEGTRQLFVVRIEPVKRTFSSMTPWPRHTIDSASRGADGVKLADANGDGLMDITTGWEEGGKIRVVINPGPGKVQELWPAVTVGSVASPEDAVFVDLDKDGAMDVVSSCEGGNQTMYVHWSPREPTQFLNPLTWTTVAIPCTQKRQAWMYAMPMQIDGKHGVDLVVGSKGAGASIGWLQSPADPRRLEDWTFHEFTGAGWIMSLQPTDMDGDRDLDILATDRKGAGRGVMWIENPGAAPSAETPWPVHRIGGANREVMFLARGQQSSSATVEIFVAAAPRSILQLNSSGTTSDWHSQEIPFPSGCGTAKGVASGDVDLDGQPDIVFSCERAEGNLSGVRWLSHANNQHWQDHEISGPAGVKFDRIELIDLDADGDLDVLTCEERENLGVIWYENPTR